MSDLRVANEIRRQLGGARFDVMTGCNTYIGTENSLTMNLTRNASKANRLKITLTAMDTYDMEFYRFTAMRWNSKKLCYNDPKKTVVKEFSGVCCDQLQDLFTQVTGLYTHL